MLQISEQQVRDALASPLHPLEGMLRVVERVEEAFRSLAAGTAANAPRQRVRAPKGSMLHLLGAADSHAGFIGCKAYTSSREGANFYVLLFDAASGKPLAVIEADYLGQMRTGAASGVATKYMARPDASSLAVIGSGGQAFTQVQAIACVRQLSEVRVFSRDPAKRDAFAERLKRDLQLDARSAATAKDAVEGASIVVTVTTSSTPVFFGEWIEPGMHINAAGGNAASRAELDVPAVIRAEHLVVDSLEQSKIESGELINAGRWNDVVELASVVAGKAQGRNRSQDVTLFKSNGIGLEDIALAGYIYRKMIG